LWRTRPTTTERDVQGEGLYSKDTERGDVCACPIVARKVIKANIEGCDVSIEQGNDMRKTSVQRKNGPTTPPARVTTRATITSPALAGRDVISPAFLFWFLTAPEPVPVLTLRRTVKGCIFEEGSVDL